MDLQIQRVGRFRVNFKGPNTNQCGQKNVTRELRYKVEITGDDTVLDQQGFIIDNNDIDRYFQEKYGVEDGFEFQSCENIAQEACKAFRGRLGHRRGLKKICVTVSGSDVASLSATWKRKTKLAQR